MKKNITISSLIIICMMYSSSRVWSQKPSLDEETLYRPSIHFSPLQNWVNDPNGMVYYNGTYHLFFQHHPYSNVWGPMHWGHATSKDLIHWKREPIAIYPDSLGTIFSGSAVVDQHNTSGFGKKGQIPLVAIFTQHNADKEKAGDIKYQNQSIAYSLDNGKTWTKYSGNPVLKNPGISDFRDPKVIWYAASKKWIMSLAVHDKISFYSSSDLKTWTKESDFGQNLGSHEGVWECPDLFSLYENGKEVWVLLVSMNPGGPNKGSATQYFLGSFNGKEFTANHTDTRWMDYGPDSYAGVTWSNTGKKRILIGWMSNWMYANQVPTQKWKNAMTFPRELSIKQAGGKSYLASRPIEQLADLRSNKLSLQRLVISGETDLTEKIQDLKIPFELRLKLDQRNDFSIVLSNDAGEELVIGYEKNKNQYFIDRSKSGQVSFKEGFAGRHTAPAFTTNSTDEITLLFDKSSVELFAEGGLSIMTEIFFPTRPYNRIHINASVKTVIKDLDYISLKSIW